MNSESSRQFDGNARCRWRRRLLSWYDCNARDLPWRQDRDPYRVWLSEIMLQQTRVAAVLEHYRLFLQRFPTVRKLAAARESSVLAAWSGLGYYRRARMLHAAAKTIVNRHKGEFPESVAELCSLPGVGRYTAAAIASIAFNIPAAVVDGNVERVLGRAFKNGLAEKDLWPLAEGLLSRTRPGDYNQAMMELGAILCLPRQPKCSVCPVFDLCATRGNLGQPKKAVQQRRREICYALHRRDSSIFLVQRSKGSSLMPGMWELPEIPLASASGRPNLTLRHSITVTDYVVHVMQNPAPSGTAGRWVEKRRIARLPLTGLARKILRRAQVI
jgi:A/G-specific adenine glycosylase